MADPYSDPKSGVLINKLGIANASELADKEQHLTRLRIGELKQEPIKGDFDMKHLKAIHGHIFQDVYAWAGETRTVGIAKGDSLFAPPSQIESYGEKVFKQISVDSLKGGFSGEFVKQVANHIADVNALHPFREGNGRAQRVFFEQLSKEAGRPLDFSKLNAAEWNKASAASMAGDNKLMEQQVSMALQRTRDLER